MTTSNHQLIAKIASILERINIEYEIIKGEDTDDTSLEVIQARFDIDINDNEGRSIVTSFPLTVMPVKDDFEDVYIRCTVTPFIEKEESSLPAQLYEEIAKLNNRTPLLKFAVDGDNDLELIVDLTIADLSQSRIEAILDVMANYINIYFPYLSEMVKVDPEKGS